MNQHQSFYRRHLPHYHPPYARLFITFRLAGSLPNSVIQQLRAEADSVATSLDEIAHSSDRISAAYAEEKRMFGRWDTWLDCADSGPTWLKQPEIAQIVSDSLHRRNRVEYKLFSFCIMSNHVHILIEPSVDEVGNPVPISKIMHSLKRYTAREANRLLDREGQFWQHESYDHAIRDASEFDRVFYYIRNNPVKARLVKRAEDWPWTYP